ncbi:MAG: acylneuraminate cytidylyltransferase family protein [Lachnospiraceae bacterium]|nr:acylneuraminate cytidylyltransferase family protein [Lachnospiraceae bacterium]
MKILFTICGRAGSKGIKSKNIQSFVGNYLPYYTISALDLFLKNTDLDISSDIIVNSDSDMLIKIMKENTIRPVEIIKRNPNLAGDTIGKIEVIKDCLVKMEERKGYSYEIVVDLDITSPLRTSSDIDKLIKKHIDKHPDVTISVTSARRNPYFNQVMSCENGVRKVIESDYTARQQAPKVFDMNASLYAYSPGYLKSGRNILDGYCEYIEMYDTGVLDIDNENDFELMEVIAKYLFKKTPGFAEIYKNI